MTLRPHVVAGMTSIVCAFLSSALGGCQESRENAPTLGAGERHSEQPVLEEQGVPDEAQVGFTAKLKQVHQFADTATSREEKQEAARRLTAAFEEAAHTTSPHVVAVRQDLAARASQLQLEEAPLEAKRLAEMGLALSDAPSVLRANLFIALADAEEALAKPSEARSALVSALAINQQLFEAELMHP